MLKKNIARSTDSYGFRFAADRTETIAQLYSVGHERRETRKYSWDSLKRKDHGILLQYTLSGEGGLTVEGTDFRVGVGQAMLLNIPGEHRYYCVEDKAWEFIYIFIRGEEVQKLAVEAQRKLGHIVSLSPDDRLIQLLWDIHRMARERRIDNSYTASSLAYQFMMELLRCADRQIHSEILWPQPIIRAVAAIASSYADIGGLDHLAESSGLSKYHFIRQFRHYVGMSPIEYLTKIRMEQAAALLRHSDLTIQQIALRVGYDNGNYFAKVFRKTVGVAPGEFRQGRDAAPVDYLTIR